MTKKVFKQIKKKLLIIIILYGALTVILSQPMVSIPGEQMRIDLDGSRVSSTDEGWNIELRMAHDNDSHPDFVYRRWWYCQLNNLNPDTGETLHIRITNAGYRDIILPVWSLDGGPFERIPQKALPEVSESAPYTHFFTLVTPPGVSSLRLARYFPYTVSNKDAFLASIVEDSRTKVAIIGYSYQNRPIHRLDITNFDIEEETKHRVWIQGQVHPGETPPAFVVEGLVNFLLSGESQAGILLDKVIFNIVPMVNPDGVAAGNYRVNTRLTESNPHGANLEEQWAEPWNSDEPEVAALRKEIEKMMGTIENPAPAPIQIFLNLHAAHLREYPYHYLHRPAWSMPGDYGVNQEVHDLGAKWIEHLRRRSPFVALGRTSQSTLGEDSRPYVEGMMFDRWSRHEKWTGDPNYQQPVMAITYETTYGMGPDRKTWNTPDDYRHNGREIALAIGDFFGLFDGKSREE